MTKLNSLLFFAQLQPGLGDAVPLFGMSLTMEDFTPADLDRALEGDARILGRLVDSLTPVIQVRVGRTLLRRMPAAAPNRLRQEVEDLIQEVMMALFADGARVLRNWTPDRGLSLLNYVGLVAERLVFTILQSRKKTWPAEFRPQEELDGPTPDHDPEARLRARQAFGQILDYLEQELSPQGFDLFKMLFVEELSVAEVRSRTELSDDAIYAWRSRLRRKTRRLLQELNANPTTAVGVEG